WRSSLATAPRMRPPLPSCLSFRHPRTTALHSLSLHDALPIYGGTDAGAVHLTRSGVPSGVVSIPTRYLHTPAEMVDLGDAAAAADLLTAVLRRDLTLTAGA